jgi:AcrR family transcriptional regulator
MARWESNAVGRLREAALELYRDPGYDKVTVAEIAARAGLTKRTFFRYFADKREVLFLGTDMVEMMIAQRITDAPEGAPAFEAVATALAIVAQRSDEDRAHAQFARQRHQVIQAYAELRERELGKHASLSSAMAAALRGRGVADPAARLAAEVGLAAFKVGFDRWIEEPRRKLGTHVRDAMRGMGAVVLGSVVIDPSPRANTRAPKKRRR